MMYREIIAVCSQIHTKHINTLCGQNGELLKVKLVVHIVTTGLYNSYISGVMSMHYGTHKDNIIMSMLNVLLLIRFLNNPVLCVPAGFCRQVEETLALLGHYTA